MPRVEEFQLHPLGWEKDPEEERFKFSTLDYLSTTTYTNSGIFFKLKDSEKIKVTAILKEGLERTFSQIRHLVGTIEKDEDGHSIVRKNDSTVQFVIQHLDSKEYPSFAEIEGAHFLTTALGDLNVISNSPMTCGNKPEAHPDNSPVIASVKANFIAGGLILMVPNHHWCNGIGGFASSVKQLAENCYAIANATEFPSFDPRCLDREYFGLPGFNKSADSKLPKVDAPPRINERHAQHRPSQSLFFHLRKSRANELKKAASPSDGTWISTYNAVCALMWRVMSRLRIPVYKPDLDSKPLWATGVSLAKLYNDPPMPARMQFNTGFDISSIMSTVPQLTLAEVVSEAPLSKLASYTRQLTDEVTPEMLSATLQKVAHVRNKHDLSINLDSFPPLAILVSDWRAADISTYDFGFAEPIAWRHFFGGVPLCQAVVYAPHKGPAGDDEGMEVQVTFEKEIVQQLVHDPEWSRYFEYRGVDASEEEPPSNPKSKL